MVDIWNKKIPRADKILSIKDGVCQLHFTPSDIHTTKIYIDSDGSEIVYPLIRPKLKFEAVPCIFPNLPSYLSSKNLKKRKPPDQRTMTLIKEKRIKSSSNNVRL